VRPMQVACFILAAPATFTHSCTTTNFVQLQTQHAVSGSVGVTSFGTSFMLKNLGTDCQNGAGSAAFSCDICVHEATSCTEAATTPHLTHAKYTPDGTGSATGSVSHSIPGAHAGHALVIHAHDGSALACAMLRSSTPVEVKHWSAMEAERDVSVQRSAAIRAAPVHAPTVLLEIAGGATEAAREGGHGGAIAVGMSACLLALAAALVRSSRRPAPLANGMNEAAPLKQSQGQHGQRV